MKPFYQITLLTLLFLTSCGTKYEYWETSKFVIDNTALAESEEIKLLYASRGPNKTADKDFYYHLIVISQKTGDTVNILTTVNNNITESDENKIYNFYSEDGLLSNLMRVDPKELTEIKKIDDVTEMNPPKRLDKVARDPAFDVIANNNYPTVIGFIGSDTVTVR